MLLTFILNELAIFFLVYVPLSIIIGKLDYVKGSVPMDQQLLSLSDPWRVDVAKALSYLCENKNVEAQRILKKWVDGNC